jgi:hypothetical protein
LPPVGTGLLVLGVAALVVTAALLASLLRIRSPAQFVLATYVLGWAMLATASLALSVPGWLTRPGLLAALLVMTVVGFGAWRVGGAPAPPLHRRHVVALVDALRDPILAGLACVLALGFAYVAALTVFTPQNDGDPLVYQLARAALWRQEHRITVFDVSFDPRLDGNPILAEIGQLATMLVAGSDRYVGIGQLASAAALSVGVYALGRHVLHDRRAALFGALVVPMLPVVALQAFGAGNDLVVASFVVAAAAFGVGRSSAELALLGLAVALAVATKFTAPLLLPALGAVVVAAAPRRAPASIAVMLAGCLAGAGWYVANLVRTGDLDGGLAESGDQEPQSGLGDAAFTLSRLVLDSIDGSGVIGAWEAAFVVAAAALAVVLLRAGVRVPVVVAATALVALTPLVMSLVGRAIATLLAAGWERIGNPTEADVIRDWSMSRVANGYESWFGPIAAVAVVSILVVAVRQNRRHAAPAVAIAIAAAPIVTLVLVGALLAYDPSRGRFLVAAMAMGCSLWGVALRVRWLAAAVSCLVAVAFGLVLVNAQGKPSRLQAGDYAHVAPIWTLARWEAQTLLRPSPPERAEANTIRFVEENVPGDARVALALRRNAFVFPYFGPRLQRRIELLDDGDRPSQLADWMVVAPGATPRACRADWSRAFGAGGWSVWRRSRSAPCDRPAHLAP